MRFSNLVTGAFFIALAIGIIFLSAGFDASAGQRFGPGLFPTCTALLMGAAGSALFIKAWLQREVRPWVELADWWREKRLVSGAAAWSWARDGGGDGSREGTHGARDGATPDTSARLPFGRVGIHHPRLEARARPGGGYETPSTRAVPTEHR